MESYLNVNFISLFVKLVVSKKLDNRGYEILCVELTCDIDKQLASALE